MIYDIIISPLETIFDWVFHYVQNNFPQAGIIGAIFGVSLAMNILALPLYNVADKIQDKERKISKSLEHWTNHIKRTFSGDERFMMLSEYYRQNHYHPVYALRSTFSILIQVPFFIAAYHYLRNSSALNGASFFIVKDLGAADNLIPIKLGAFSFTINILPVIMTAINCFSGAIYSKGQTAREKFQIYFLAAIFLVLLYNSPSGLVIYWILNNIFSLFKNFIKKSKNKARLVYFAFSIYFLIFTHVSALKKGSGQVNSSIVNLVSAWLILFLPFIIKSIKRTRLSSFIGTFSDNIKGIFHGVKNYFTGNLEKIKQPADKFFLSQKRNLPLLIFSGGALALLCGFTLPSNVISTSPIEFSFLGNTDSPLTYIRHASFVCAGFFIFYPVVFYFLFGNKTKAILPVLMFAFFICALCNSYIFKIAIENLDVSFNISDASILNPANALFIIIPLELFVAAGITALLLNKTKKIYISLFAFACCIGMAGTGLINTGKIKSAYFEYARNHEKYGVKKDSIEGIEPVYHLSKSGKNIIVLFLDRGIGPFAGEIFENYPEIKKQFDGFTYYPNTVSFSGFTVEGAPPLYGGYEYNQENMNKRENELLRDKNTESQLVLPKLFMDAGYSATMTDPIWPNYRWSGDLSPYEKLPGFTVKEVEGVYYDEFLKEKNLEKQFAGNEKDKICKNQIINFSLLQAIYPKLREGFYKNVRLQPKEMEISPEAESWLRKFSNLYFLPQLTDFECPSEKGAYISIHSMAAHDVYNPADDFESPAQAGSEPNIEGSDRERNTEIHYRADVAAFKQFGKFFDYLRKNNCFDNTRIIVVSDHGRGVNIKQCESWKNQSLVNWYSAMLLVKDFNSNFGLVTDKSFMTNADTIFFAKQGLDLSDTNPYTKKKLTQQKEKGVNVYWCVDWNANNFVDAHKFQLDMKDAWHVSNDIYKEENWIPLANKKSNGDAK